MGAGATRNGWPWAALVAAAGIGVFLNSLSNGFALDDLPMVRDNPAIVSPLGIPSLFVQPYWPGGETSGLYRPLTVASFAVNRALLGSGALGFHLLNVLLHGLVCALAWFAVRRAGLRIGAATAAGMLFAVHPLHVEAVANVVGRAELLAAAGVLGAWLAHRRAAEAEAPRRAIAWSALACCLYLGALLSKEGALLAPLVFLADDRFRGRSRSGRARIAPYLGYAVALALALALRLNALGALRGAEDVAFIDNPALAHGAASRVGTALWVLVRYAGLFVWPARLSSDYSYDAIPAVTSLADPRWLAGLALAGIWLALALRGWRRSRAVLFGTLIAALTLLPSSNLLFASGTLMAERLTYLPSLGGCVLVGCAIAPLLERRRSLALALMVAAVVPLAVRSWQRNPAWKDNETLTRIDLQTQPRSAKLWAGAGIVHQQNGRAEEARRDYEEALGIYPDYAQVRYNLGELLADQGQIDEAIDQLRRAAAIAPSNPRPYKTLARLLQRSGRMQEAIEAFRRGIELDRSDHRLRFDLGSALLASGQRAAAIEVFFDLAVDAPEEVEGGISRALVVDWQGRRGEAIRILRGLLERGDLTAADRRSIEHLIAALESDG